MDLYDRKIIGYAYGRTMTAELALEAVKNACLNVSNTEGIILHSDLGSQYTGDLFERYMQDNGFIHSFSRKRDLLLNVKIFRIIKEIVPRLFFDFLECFFNSHILKTEFHSRILRMNGLSIRNPNGHEHKHNKEPHKQRYFTNCP